ncbi:MAG: protein serine/threonine phosphatase 2C family protein [Proteobacteria bacterium]|nr:protein serine/threonine phosphatase 2C family protein [Pseudomonadota bacterium]
MISIGHRNEVGLSVTFAQTRGTFRARTGRYIHGRNTEQEDAILFGRAHELVTRDVVDALKSVFADVARDIGPDDVRVGTTAALAYLNPAPRGGYDVITAHLGDSRIALLSVKKHTHDKKGSATYRSLTKDHKAIREAARIKECGGTISPAGRLDDRLNMGRCFGHYGMAGLSYEPEISVHRIARPREGRALYVVAHTDGALTYPDDGRAVPLITAPWYCTDYPGDFARILLEDELTHEAALGGKVDNASLVLAEVLPEKATETRPPIIMGVFDGHGAHDANPAAFSARVAKRFARAFRA